MDVGIEMAVDALHPPGEVDVLQMDRLRELIRVIMVDRLIVEREQSPLAVLLEDRPEDPAMPVIVGELGVL